MELNQKFSIDRNVSNKNVKKIEEKIPNVVSQMVVKEVLSNVGGFDWNDPVNVVHTIAEMMSIDLTVPLENQILINKKMDLTILVPSNVDKNVPYWICQSIIRVDEKFGNRYINYEGSLYNKIDIIFESEYFKKFMDKVADLAYCTWNVRWGNSKNPETRLSRKTRPGASQENETWLDKCVKHLLTDKDTEGINIKNLIMIEFKKKN